jgi:putative resolvase
MAIPTTAFGLYARVSSHDQKSDLDRQVARLSTWAAQAGGQVVRVEAEIGSGMNGSRSKVRRLLADPAVTTVVVEHRDRLGRMNTELVEAALSAHGRRLVVLDDGEVDDDLVRDMVEVLTSFCARLYGRRSARNRALKAVGCAQRDIGPQAVIAAESVVARREND